MITIKHAGRHEAAPLGCPHGAGTRPLPHALRRHSLIAVKVTTAPARRLYRESLLTMGSCHACR
ncbi:hypothetical protein [Dyella ginsengisoli]|uniref:hypothetical protein n=1 Tax=Dyella ginsengisoli TaxID=363848 RepID=UPI0018E24893|nr:hypothetical protein [Dyella ginsengisoli]